MIAQMRPPSRPNILISSTRQWNPGDEFILLGARRLLEATVGTGPNYLLWNRNPDLFVDRWKDPQLRPGFLTNSSMEPSLDLVDLVVLAGTPEWFGRPVERIFRELLRYPTVPLIALGVGGAGHGFALNPQEREVLQRENSLIICRNPVLAQEINDQLGSTKAVVLPCPALFCSPADIPRTLESFHRGLPTINVQADVVENQSVPTPFVEQLIQHIQTRETRSATRFVAHYVDEFHRFSRLFRDADIFFSYEPLDYIRFYREQPRALITSRLHGAIASLSCGTPACLFDFGSDRVAGAATPFGDLLPCLPFDDAVAWLERKSPEQCVQDSEAIVDFRQSSYQRYLIILADFFQNHLSFFNSGEQFDDAA
jgi:hypothetical protein